MELTDCDSQWQRPEQNVCLRSDRYLCPTPACKAFSSRYLLHCHFFSLTMTMVYDDDAGDNYDNSENSSNDNDDKSDDN